MDAHQAMEVEMTTQVGLLYLNPAQKIRLASELRVAVAECRDRGLGVSAKWASELLSSIPAEYRLPQRPNPVQSHMNGLSPFPQPAPAHWPYTHSAPPPPLPPNHADDLQFLVDAADDPALLRSAQPDTIKVSADYLRTNPTAEEQAALLKERVLANQQAAILAGTSPGRGEARSPNVYGYSTPGYNGNGMFTPGLNGFIPPIPRPSGIPVPLPLQLSSPFFDPSQPGVSSSTPPQLRAGSYKDGGLNGPDLKRFASGPGSEADLAELENEGMSGAGEGGGVFDSPMSYRNVGAGLASVGSPLGTPSAGPSSMQSGYPGYPLHSTPAQRQAQYPFIQNGTPAPYMPAYQTPENTRPLGYGSNGFGQPGVQARAPPGQPQFGSANGAREDAVKDDEDVTEADEDGRGAAKDEDGIAKRGGLPFAEVVDKVSGEVPGSATKPGPGPAGLPSNLAFNIGWHGDRPVVGVAQQPSGPVPPTGTGSQPTQTGHSYPRFDATPSGPALHPHLAAKPIGALSAVPNAQRPPPFYAVPPNAPPPLTKVMGPDGNVRLYDVQKQQYVGVPPQMQHYLNTGAPAPQMYAYAPTLLQPPRGPPLTQIPQGRQPERPEDLEALEQDTFELAKSYFESKELERCKIVLEKCKSKRARFLSLYSQYLAADKRSQELLPHFLDSKTEMETITPQIYPLIEELDGEDDPYLLYLKGLLYARIGQKDRALEAYIGSLRGAPYNWSCWLNVAMIVQSADEYLEIKALLPQGVMLGFFAVAVMLDLHSATELMMNTIDKLEETFTMSVHLKACRALVLYHMRDFDRAEKAFDDVRRIDPFRLDEIEIYSNMLYVMNKKAKLGKMAHEYAQIDKNRAEVCCLIGNYYSARNEHTKAIQYFKRSLQLNRDYLPAWTLMGHEYVEIKNSHAAVESYRRAIECNPKDYRAWYGLGQTYELLDMPFYAVQYYSRATALRPYDCRMWSALADLYQTLKRPADAIACDYRALHGADPSQTLKIMLVLADLHDSLRELTRAADCHERYIVLAEKDNAHIGETARSYLYVARYHLGLLHRDRNADIAAAPPPAPSTDADGMDVEKPDAPDVAALKALKPAELERGIGYLHKVIQSNAPLKEEAQEEWRYVQKRLNLPQPAWAQV